MEVSAEYTSVRDQVAIKFGRQLAASLTRPEVREFIKTAVLEQFDGDYNFLFGTHKDKTLQVTAPDGRTTEMSFKEVLFGPGAANARSQESAFLDSLATLYPLLQIALPELEVATAESWETGSEVPLIAIVPENMEKKGITTIAAYDTEGNTYELSVEEEPDKLVIVVSGNEGLIGVEKQAGGRLDCPIDAEPYYTNGNTDYYIRDDYYNSLNRCNQIAPPGGGNDNPNNCACQRDCKTTQEKLFKIKFSDIEKLRKVEKWVLGKVELEIYLVYGTKNSAGYFTATFAESRKDLRRCQSIWGNCEPIWRSLNRKFTEFLTDYGSNVVVFMTEVDDFPFTANKTVVLTTTIDGEVYIHNVSVEVSSPIYKALGEVEIRYCDQADSPGKFYSNNFVDFYWGQD